MKTTILNLFWGVIFLLTAKELLADPLNQWTWRFPYPQGSTLNAVTYGGGKFVAVGANGTIITSPDGYNWTNQTFGVFPNLQGVAYADGEYAAVGDGGLILVSSNAMSWTQIASLTNNTLHGIAGNSSWLTAGMPQFLAVGDAGTMIKCLNKTNWSVVASVTSNSLYGVQSISPALYIIAGALGSVIKVSTSGYNLRPYSFVGNTNNLYAVASDGNGIVAAVGDLNQNPWNYPPHSTNEILYSLNSGSRWSPQLWVDGLDQYGRAFWFPSQMFILGSSTFVMGS